MIYLTCLVFLKSLVWIFSTPIPLIQKKNYENRTQENILCPIKNLEKYFTIHQYMPKTFHDPDKNPPASSPIYLMYGA